MNYVFPLSFFFQLLNFSVLADDPFEDYYFATTTLLFEEKEENIVNLVMRREDIEWNHLYLSTGPLQPLTLHQNFSNGVAWFASFREMLNFRVGALYYKKRQVQLSKHCSMMAAYLTMFQLILKQQRLYEFSNIIDNYNKEKSFSILPGYFKPVKDSNTGRDALATAKNMELLSKVTEVLKDIMDDGTVRKQYPVPAKDPWIFPSNEELSQKNESPVAIVKRVLSRDFYANVREAPQDGDQAAQLATQLEGLQANEPSLEVSYGGDFGPTAPTQLEQQPTAATVSKEGASSSKAPVQISAEKAEKEKALKQKEQSDKEIEILWQKHAEKLPTIDQRYENLLEEDDVFYYKSVWQELITVYGDAFTQVTQYFHFAMFGRSYRSSTTTSEDYVPSIDESVAIWKRAEELFLMTRSDYMSETSNLEEGWKSHPITILQSIEKTRYTHRIQDAEIDEEQTRREWTLEYVDPRSGQADLKVV